jgi:MFS family permease
LPPRHRNVTVLAVGQVVGLAAAPLVILVGGIVGGVLAPSPALATLPIAMMVVGTAVSSVPAALLMARIGRRAGFMLGAVMGSLGCMIAARAIADSNFAAFCAATFLIGFNLAFVQQYRFAAMESVPPGDAGRAVSWVLLGGVIGGLLGPELGRQARNLMSVEYVAPFLFLGVLHAALGLFFAAGLRDIRPDANITGAAPRPLRVVIAQPAFRTALVAGVVAYGVMSLIMTATPISMHVLDGHSVDATAFVIESHVVAMYVPSLLTGRLITRYGAPRVMFAGAMALGIAAALVLTGQTLLFYLGGLVALGSGWNLIWVSATVLLGETYRPAERFRVQALNDFVVFAVQATASLSAGALLHTVGWRPLVSMALPAIALVLILSAILPRVAHSTTALIAER